MTLPSVYIYGMPIKAIDDSRYGGLYGNATRSVGLAFNLATLGHKVYLEVENDFENKITHYSKNVHPIFVRESDRAEVLKSADILLSSFTNFESFKTLFGRLPYLEHPNRAYVNCFVMGGIEKDLLKGVKFVTFNNRFQNRLWEKKRVGVPSFVIPFGVNELSMVEEAILPVKGQHAIWIGEIRSKDVLTRILKFAEANQGCRVSVVTRKIFDHSIKPDFYGGHRNAYWDCSRHSTSKSELLRVIKDTSLEQNVFDNLSFLGPKEGENHILLGQATIGFDFSRSGQHHDNTKVLDYLRSGCAVISDEGSTSSRFVKQFNYGYVIPEKFDIADARKAFLRCANQATYGRRKRISRIVRKAYGWQRYAKKLSYLLRCSSKRDLNAWDKFVIKTL